MGVAFNVCARLVLFLLLPFALSDSHAAIFSKNGKVLSDFHPESPEINWELMSIKDSDSASWGGIGLLYPSNCTATWVETHGKGDAPAYVLTAAHCVGDGGDLPPGDDIAIDRKMRASSRFVLNFFADADLYSKELKDYQKGERQKAYAKLKSLPYISIKGTDIALVALEATYQNLVDKGFRPIPISPAAPAIGEAVYSIGIPASYTPPTWRFSIDPNAI